MTSALESEVVEAASNALKDRAMAERDVRPGSNQKADLASRSHLLMPIMEGNTLGSEDVSGFLAGRLSLADEQEEPRSNARLS
jgi:hypothetical protein